MIDQGVRLGGREEEEVRKEKII